MQSSGKNILLTRLYKEKQKRLVYSNLTTGLRTEMKIPALHEMTKIYNLWLNKDKDPTNGLDIIKKEEQ